MTGIDIVKISRFEKNIDNERFMKKLFSDKEITFFNNKTNPIESIAGAFAAKEAFSKSIGTGIKNFSLNQISVMHSKDGMPYFKFDCKLKNMLDAMGFTGFDLSISHEKEFAVATVVSHRGDISQNYLAYLNTIKKFNDKDTSKIISPDIISKIITKRKDDMHKGDAGRILVIAGSKGLTGAAILASKACLKSGGGLITLACPESLNNIFESSLIEVMTMPLNDADGTLTFKDYSKILKKANECDAVLVGPGLSVTEETEKIVLALIKDVTKPLIIDADGINIISKNINVLSGHRQDIVITPHIGEFARLTGLSIDDILKDPEGLAEAFARKYNLCLVLKSHKTIVCSQNDGQCSKMCNILGNPGMATGGTGDVLAGVIASFTAQFKSSANGALAGVYIHSLAGDMASFLKGEYGITPTDITEQIPYAIKYSIGGN